MSLLGRRGTSSERSGPQSRPVTMEARALWLLAVLLAWGSSSLADEYVGLCEYRSGLAPQEGGAGVGGWEERGR